jgi:hypothetical protein
VSRKKCASEKTTNDPSCKWRLWALVHDPSQDRVKFFQYFDNVLGCLTRKCSWLLDAKQCSWLLDAKQCSWLRDAKQCSWLLVFLINFVLFNLFCNTGCTQLSWVIHGCYCVCLRPESYVPNVASFSGLSILDCPFGFFR